MDIEEYARRFDEEPGYLDFAYAGPVGRTVREEILSLTETMARGRFGSFSTFADQDARVRDAVAAIIGFHPDQVSFQPSAGIAFMHAMFGVTGGLALSRAEFPAITYAADRSAAALGVLAPTWLDTDGGRITPGNLRDQLTSSVVAVALSLVDFRTGFLADLDGIRQVIGDRLLIVDATQAIGVVDAPWHVADVVIAAGYKWPRAGWGTGFLALNERALEHLTPVWSGFAGDDGEGMALDAIRPPAASAGKFLVSNPDPIAQARLAAALEEMAEVGVAALNAALAEKVSRVIDVADEFAVPVVSPRAENERAGIVVLQPAADQLTPLVASLHNHGVTVTARGGSVRVSPHVSTDEESFTMLRSALQSFATAITV
jgi:selenocysteine lyase/cysteine desulfurase